MKLLNHILCFTIILALSPCKEVVSLFDSGTITKTILPITERENQGDTKEKIEKEKEDQIITKAVSWSFSNLYFVGMLVDDHSPHSENHSKTETPPPNSRG